MSEAPNFNAENESPFNYRPHQRKASFTLICSMLALLLSATALILVIYGGNLSLASSKKRLARYDLTTPKETLVSFMTMQLNGGFDTLREYYRRAGEGRLRELLKTLKVHSEAEYAGKKILFVSYDRRGTKKYETFAFEKDAESGLWELLSLRSYEIKNSELAKRVTTWEEKTEVNTFDDRSTKTDKE